MANYDTNLAAEYHVMSCLHRLGMTASLTLGNKKGVDILVARENGDSVTVEVKGVAKRYDWTLGKINPDELKRRNRHYFVLVTFNGKIADPQMPSPEVWVVPSPSLNPFIRYYNKRTNVSRAAILKDGAEYKHAWSFISGVKGPEGAAFTDAAELEELLLAVITSGPASAMTAERKARIYGRLKR